MEGGERRMKLFCPSLSKTIQFVAREDQKLDLGSIARAFGLDPNTLKLNGYFISRGADLIASTITWQSLIRFFSARRLPTGAAAASAPLLVDGKLSKIGSKSIPPSLSLSPSLSLEGDKIVEKNFFFPEFSRNRFLENYVNLHFLDWGSHDVEEAANVVDNTGFRQSKRPQHKHCSVPGLQNSSALCLKRKWGLEDESCLKRARSDESRFSSSVISNNLKRMRIDEIVAATPSKKLR